MNLAADAGDQFIVFRRSINNLLLCTLEGQWKSRLNFHFSLSSCVSHSLSFYLSFFLSFLIIFGFLGPGPANIQHLAMCSAYNEVYVSLVILAFIFLKKKAAF